MDYQPKNSRDLLTALGVGSFNATMLIETLMMTPAATEAGSAPVMLLVQHIQLVLQQLAPTSGVSAQGVIDAPTDLVLRRIAGEKWLFRTWFDVARMVVAAQRKGMRVDVPRVAAAPPRTDAIGLFDLGLPDVPGGIVTYGVGAYLLYRALKKRRK